MSITNGDGGLVLIMIESVSPARTLVCEQKPSIHGQRYRVFGSTRVFVNNQSVVPGFAFSVRMSSRCGDVPAMEPDTKENNPLAAAPRKSSRRSNRPGPAASLIVISQWILA